MEREGRVFQWKSTINNNHSNKKGRGKCLRDVVKA